ncbi:MAG: TonB-dependent receptor [Cyclobacteriaceae bacterium]
MPLRLFLLIFSISLSYVPLFSQNPEKSTDTVLLTDYLSTLEENFSIKFTYRDDDVRNLQIPLPDTTLSLMQILETISNTTDLRFEILSDRYVAISANQSDSKPYCLRLLDAETLEPVPYALVTSEKNFAESDSLGRVILSKMKPPLILYLSHISYQSERVNLGELSIDGCDSLLLQPKYSVLNEIMIPDYFITGLNRLNGGEMSFNRDQLPVLPGLSEPDIFFSMQALPGIQSASESISDINIRGGRNDQNLVVWNGIRMYQTGHFFGLISMFNPYLTDKLSVVKSGTEAQYGNGVAGVIDIRSEDNVVTEFSGESGLNLLGGDVILTIPILDKVSARVAARRSFSDVLISPTYKRYFNRAFRNTAIETQGRGNQLVTSDEKFKFSDVAAVVNGSTNESNSYQLSFLHTDNTLRHDETELVNGTREQRQSKLNQQSTALGLLYEQTIYDKILLTSELKLSDYQQVAVNDDILNGQTLIQSNSVNDLGLRLGINVPLTENIRMNAGYQLNEITVENEENLNKPSFNRLIRDVVSSHVLYTDFNISPGSERLALKAGIRSTFYGNYKKFYPEPRVSVNYTISDHLKIEVSGEYKHQVLSQVIDLQTDFLGVIKNRWVAASDSSGIPVMRSRQFSGGIFYDDGQLLLSADLYYKQIEGIITSAEGFRNQFEFIRAEGKQEVAGVELLFNKNFDKLSTWLSYSLMSNSNDFSAIYPLDFPSERDISHQITLGARYRLDKLEYAGSVNYQAGTPYTAPLLTKSVTEGRINYNTPNSSQLSGYLRIDLSVRYKFKVGQRYKAMAGLSVWNFTGHENLIDTYYRLENDEEVKRIRGFALRFTPNAMFRVYF